MNSRRSILRGAVGAGAAVAVGGNASGQMAARALGPVGIAGGLNYAGRGPEPCGDPLFDTARHAAIKLAEENRQREEQRIHREIESLQRIRSISEAYRAYRIRQLYHEQNGLWDIFHKAIASI